MKRRIAFSVVSIRCNAGFPPASGNVAGTFENLVHVERDPQTHIRGRIWS
jgi:hypothetical protein